MNELLTTLSHLQTHKFMEETCEIKLSFFQKTLLNLLLNGQLTPDQVKFEVFDLNYTSRRRTSRIKPLEIKCGAITYPLSPYLAIRGHKASEIYTDEGIFL